MRLLVKSFVACSPFPRRKEKRIPHMVAGIDVHKKMLAVVVTDTSAEGAWTFQRRKFETLPKDLEKLAEWLGELRVEEAVMESTAQYWKPVLAARTTFGMPSGWCADTMMRSWT